MNIKQRSSHNRGQALIIALALIFFMMLLVAATGMLTTQQLRNSRIERDYEVALQMAEAGLNAYLNGLANGTTGVTNGQLVPARANWEDVPGVTGVPTLLQVKGWVLDGTLNGTASSPRFIFYPNTGTQAAPSQKKTGYVVGHVGTVGSFVTIVAYGYSNGVVRRVRGTGRAFSIFDWAALWGLNPGQTGTDTAWNINGDFTVVGAFGGEGRMLYGSNNNFWDGPSIISTTAGSYYGGQPNNPGPPIGHPTILGPSSPNNPPGHIGNGVRANPATKYYARSLGFPTATEAANDNSGTTQGLDYYLNNNDNAAGLRYLVWQNNQPNTIRVLNGSYSIMAPNTYRLRGNQEWNPSNATLTGLGMQSGETFYGIYVYPGNYYFEQIAMASSSRLVMRTFSDTDRGSTSPSIFDPGFPVAPVVQNDKLSTDPASPAGHPALRDIRFWIRNLNTGQQEATQFESGTVMAYPKFPSRFRCYIAAKEQVQVHGTQSSPLNFYTNMLVYDRDSNGGFGNINFSSSVYLRGSLIAWHVERSGSATVEKVAPELGPDDVLTYLLDNWTELP